MAELSFRTRSYFKRSQRVTVREIEGMVAVRMRDGDGGEPLKVGDPGSPAAALLRETLGEDIREDVLAAFERAHWRFLLSEMGADSAGDAWLATVPPSRRGIVVLRGEGSLTVVNKRLIVQLREVTGSDDAARLRNLGLILVTELRFAPHLYLVEAPDYEDALAASEGLIESPDIALAEPEFIEHISQRLIPEDPDYFEQWHWNNSGQGGGTPGADLRCERAWDMSLGRGCRVAVIDNGFHTQHRDYAEALTAQCGYFGNASAAPFIRDVLTMPEDNHGTGAAGLIGGRQNTRGGCGGSPECELTLIACLPDQLGTQTTLARAVAYAADPSLEDDSAAADGGADVLSCSLGPNTGHPWPLSTSLELAISYAAWRGRSWLGMPIFWACSNRRNVDVTLDEVVSHEDVIAIVRSDRFDGRRSGAVGEAVELTAPGSSVYTTQHDDGYEFVSGTSYAAPIAASVAALALAVNPCLPVRKLRRILRKSADEVGGVAYDSAGHNEEFGYGRVNAYRAVKAARWRSCFYCLCRRLSRGWRKFQYGRRSY